MTKNEEKLKTLLIRLKDHYIKRYRAEAEELLNEPKSVYEATHTAISISTTAKRANAVDAVLEVLMNSGFEAVEKFIKETLTKSTYKKDKHLFYVLEEAIVEASEA